MTEVELPGLRGKTAVVTGASRGVGAATALLLARCGVGVALGYRSRDAEAAAVLARVKAFGVEGVAVRGDLAREESAGELFDGAEEVLGGVDFFVGNAGVWPPEDVPLARMATEQWRHTLAANLDSVFFTTREAARRLRPGGAVVLVGSTAGQRGEAFHGDYAATKGALMSLVKGLCVELAPAGIRVNAVAPGWIDTEMVSGALAGEAGARAAAGIPLGRIATADDVAGPIAFLCSQLARHVTGEILNVNGGSVLVG